MLLLELLASPFLWRQRAEHVLVRLLERLVALERKRLLELLPRSELHVFGQCGHWTQIEKKDRFVSVVDNFLCAA